MIVYHRCLLHRHTIHSFIAAFSSNHSKFSSQKMKRNKCPPTTKLIMSKRCRERGFVCLCSSMYKTIRSWQWRPRTKLNKCCCGWQFCLPSFLCDSKKLHTEDDIQYYTFFSGWWQFPSPKQPFRAWMSVCFYHKTKGTKWIRTMDSTYIQYTCMYGLHQVAYAYVCAFACASVRQVRLYSIQWIVFIPILISGQRNGHIVSAYCIVFVAIEVHCDFIRWFSPRDAYKTLAHKTISQRKYQSDSLSLAILLDGFLVHWVNHPFLIDTSHRFEQKTNSVHKFANVLEVKATKSF